MYICIYIHFALCFDIPSDASAYLSNAIFIFLGPVIQAHYPNEIEEKVNIFIHTPN